MLRLLLDGGASISAVDSRAGRRCTTPADSGHRDAAAFLLSRGADVGAAAADGWTPLHFAAANGNADTAALLLRHGAAVDAATAGRTALQVAAHSGMHAQAAPEDGGGDVPAAGQLDIPAAQGHLDTALLLIQHGAAYADVPDAFTAALAPRLAGVVGDAAGTRRALQALTVAAAREMARLRLERAAAADQQAAAEAARAALAAERAAWEQAQAAAEGGGQPAAKRARHG